MAGASIVPLHPAGLLTASEAAAYLRISLRQLRRHVADGLPFVALGPRCYRYRLEDLQRWVDERVMQLSTSEDASTGAASRSAAAATLSRREKEILSELSKPRKSSARRLFLKRRHLEKLGQSTDPQDSL